MRRFLVLAAAAALLSGCAALDLKRPVPAEELARTHHIGVASTFDDTFNGSSIGLTVFNNDFFTAQVPEWHVGQFATDKAVELLTQHGRFGAAPLDLGSAGLAKLEGPEQLALLLAAARKHGDDTLLVIYPGVSDNNPWFKPGYGLFERFGHRCVYAGYIVNAYSVATGKSLGWEWGGESPCDASSSTDIPFKKQFSDYSPQERELIRKRLEARIGDSMRYALQKMALASAN